MKSRLFAKAMMPDNPSTKPLSPKEIVDRLRRPAALLFAQHRVDDLHRRRETAQAELRRAATETDPADPNRSANRARQLSNDIAEIDRELLTATAERSAAAQPFAAAVAAALAPARAAATAGAVRAIEELAAALKIIDDANGLIVRAGGAAAMKFPPIYLQSLLALRGRLARLQ